MQPEIFGNNTTTMYLTVNLSKRLTDAFAKSRTALLGPGHNKRDYHLSLLELKINEAAISSNQFKNLTNTATFNNIMMTTTLTAGNAYHIMGGKTKFWVKKYTSNNPNTITKFRTAFYTNFTKRHTGKFQRSTVLHNGTQYIVYSMNSVPWYAVPEYYFGVSKWTPHVSILTLDELKKYNPKLYAAYQRNGVNVLARAVPKMGVVTINLVRDTTHLSFSLRNVSHGIHLNVPI